jgi:cell division GTPase FtsZ
MIDADIKDLNQIIRYDGYSIGFSGNYESFDKILQNFNQYVTNAKGIYIQFILHKETSLFEVSKSVEIINNLSNENVDLLFSTQYHNIENDNSHFQILVTDIKKLEKQQWK